MTWSQVVLSVGTLLALNNYWFVEAGNYERVHLSDVTSITLRHGQMTTGRRSSPVPQLSCVGGTAGCKAVQLGVVHCSNQGSDGSDAQWECKTDMDVEYRFGKIEVSCEGYDYPEDPYVLKGSCGLKYEIDYTKEGKRAKNDSGGGWIVVVAAVILVLCCGRGGRGTGSGGGYSGGGYSGYSGGGSSSGSHSRTTYGYGGTSRR